jgi:hypothetical protein
MTVWIRRLSVLLALQVLLGIALHLSHAGLSSGPATGAPVLATAPGADKLTIEGPDKQRVELRKVDGNWQLPDEGDFPVDAARIQALLKHLSEVETGAAVSTTRGAWQRFKVADDDFERRVTLATGDKQLARLLLGNTPSPRQIYLRRETEDAVYAVDLGSWEFPTTAADWEDKGILHVALQDIRSIMIGDLTVSQTPATQADATQAPAWQAKGLGRNQALDPKAAATLAQHIADLDIGSVLGRKELPEYGLAKPALQFTITRGNGQQITYLLGHLHDSQDLVLKSSAREEYFRLPSSTASTLLDAAKHDALVHKAAGGKAKSGS